MPTALIMALAIAAAPLAAAAQGGAYTAPRNSHGQPDLSGAWTNATITPALRPVELQGHRAHTPAEVAALEGATAERNEEGDQSTDPNAPALQKGDPGGYNRGWLDPGTKVMRVAGEPRTSLITTPDGLPPARVAGAPPAPSLPRPRPPGAPIPVTGGLDHPEQRPLGERCIISFGRNGGPPMLPNGFYNNNYQFIQTADHVAIMIEMVHDLRVIRLGAKHRTDGQRPWFGDSIGWWEGDALVVETTNIPRAQAYFGVWENLKVTERFRRVGEGRMHYQFTLEDPTIWAAPWGGEYEFAALGGAIHEYACHEGNYALEGILAGARAEERDKAQAATASR